VSNRPLFDSGRASPLVFTFCGELRLDGGLDCPEPDFLKWMEGSLFADVGTAYDSYAFDGPKQEERDAWRLFHDAIEATSNFLDLYKDNPQLFRKIARQLSFLPCLTSWHPDAERFNRQLVKFAQLGQQSIYGKLRNNVRHIVRQSWPVRYAYAIVSAIELTLDTYEDKLPVWAEIYGYGIKHPIPLSLYELTAKKMGWDEAKIRQELRKYRGHYQILPKWTKSLEKLRRPFNKNHVLDYWHTGKEMILEEVPEFHLRPEWRKYREGRYYRDGAKKGAIQHAIFKDILIALRTIAGSYHRRSAPKAVTK
jgi:hypothetical protein